MNVYAQSVCTGLLVGRRSRMPYLCSLRNNFKKACPSGNMKICGKCSTSNRGCQYIEHQQVDMAGKRLELCELCPEKFKCWTER